MQAQPLSPEQVAAAAVTAPSGEPVSLEQAIDEALRREPRIEVAVQEIERAEALVRQARAAWLPTLHGNAIYTRLDDDRRVPGSAVALQQANQLQLNVSLSLPLIAPRAWLASQRAKMSVGASRASADEVRRQVVLAVARAYLAVVAQQRVIEVNQRAVDNARAHHEYARARFEGGIGNELDEVRAGQELAQSEAQLENARAQLATAQEALGVLLGREAPVDARAPEAMPLAARPAAESVEQRGDVRGARARADLAERTERDSFADYLPTLTGTFLPFYQNPPTVTFPTTGWQAQLIFTLPLYDGGLRYGLARERTAVAAQSRAQLEAALRQAKSEVRVAFSTLVQADKSLLAASRGAELARRALEMANLAYRAGATTDIEVVDAERRTRDAETSAVVAEDAARRARLELLIASGQLLDRPRK